MNIKTHRGDGGSSVTVKCWLVVCVMSLLRMALASADCPSPEPLLDFAEPVREFYADMCRESDAPLVLALDSRVKAHLQLPSGGPPLTAENIYPDKARRLNFEGSVVVAFAVELDGSVHHAKILQSSGHRSLDDAVWVYWKQYKFQGPGQLYGAPARTIILERINFKLKGGPSLPASFSDWIVDNLGLRIIRPYNHGDANALLQDIDETAKSSITLSKIEERFTRYTKQFGAMRYVEYKGLLEVKNVGGVPHYELVYLISTAIPQAGTAVLTVSAVDRGPSPGITDFVFKESPIRLTISRQR